MIRWIHPASETLPTKARIKNATIAHLRTRKETENAHAPLEDDNNCITSRMTNQVFSVELISASE